MSFVGRVVLIPFLAASVIGVVIVPLMPIALLMDPEIEYAFARVVLFGLWPMCLVFVHGAYPCKPRPAL